VFWLKSGGANRYENRLKSHLCAHAPCFLISFPAFYPNGECIGDIVGDPDEIPFGPVCFQAALIVDITGGIAVNNEFFLSIPVGYSIPDIGR